MTVVDLELRLGWWEIGDYVAIGFVILGVIGEAVADFRTTLTSATKHKLARTSTYILIAALSAELVCLVMTSQLSGQITALLSNETATAMRIAAEAGARVSEANKKAEEAKRAAEEERLERLKLEAQITPRRLNRDQWQLLLKVIAPLAGHKVRVTSYALDVEGATLAKQIISILEESGIKALDNTTSLMPIGGFGLGVHVDGRDRALVHRLALALKTQGALQAVVDTPGQQSSAGGMSASPPENDDADAVILVGVKPLSK